MRSAYKIDRPTTAELVNIYGGVENPYTIDNHVVSAKESVFSSKDLADLLYLTLLPNRIHQPPESFLIPTAQRIGGLYMAGRPPSMLSNFVRLQCKSMFLLE
jgi:hypothetical protein